MTDETIRKRIEELNQLPNTVLFYRAIFRDALEYAAKIAQNRAQYYRGVKSVGDISDWVADKLAHEIRQAALEVGRG